MTVITAMLLVLVMIIVPLFKKPLANPFPLSTNLISANLLVPYLDNFFLCK